MDLFFRELRAIIHEFNTHKTCLWIYTENCYKGEFCFLEDTVINYMKIIHSYHISVNMEMDEVKSSVIERFSVIHLFEKCRGKTPVGYIFLFRSEGLLQQILE